MSTETMGRRAEAPGDGANMIALDREPKDAQYGVYVPRERVLGTMAASAAAGIFLRNTEALVAGSAPPEVPRRPEQNPSEDLALVA